MSEKNNFSEKISHDEIGIRLADTMFGTPLNPGQIILLACEADASISKTATETQLNLPDGSKFVISQDGRILSDISKVPKDNRLFNDKPTGYRFDYIYNRAKDGGVIAVGSYITLEAREVKDVHHIFFANKKRCLFFRNIT